MLRQLKRVRRIRLPLEPTEVSVLFGEVTSSVKWRCRQRVPPPLETLRAVHLEGIQRAVYMNTWCCVVLCFFLSIGEGFIVRLALRPHVRLAPQQESGAVPGGLMIAVPAASQASPSWLLLRSLGSPRRNQGRARPLRVEAAAPDPPGCSHTGPAPVSRWGAKFLRFQL